MKSSNETSPSYSLNMMKIILRLFTLNYKQVGAWDCPADYVCAEGKNYYVWTNQMATMTSAQRYCLERGLLLLRVENLHLLEGELIQPNISTFIQETTIVWINAKYDREDEEYRWEDTNEIVNIIAANHTEGDCLVALNNMTRTMSADCKTVRHVVCMAPNTYWFGSSLNFKCNCRSDRCSSDGTCLDFDGRCALGWFGEGCQLRDALLDVKNKLLDFYSGSCEANRSPVNFFLKHPTYLSWVRIVSNRKVDRNMFRVIAVTSTQSFVCREAEPFIIDDNTVDMACCTDLQTVTQVSVSGTGQVAHMCSVNIYTGRNIALKGNSSLVSDATIYPAPFIVDGERGIVSPGSSSLNLQTPQSWGVEFSMDMIVLEVIIYFKYPLKADLNITLKLQSSMNVSLQRNTTDNYTILKGIKEIRILSGTLDNAKYVQVFFLPSSSSLDNDFDLSEIEVYGACIPPTYSLYCDNWCPSKEGKNVCHFDGQCDLNTEVRTRYPTSMSSVATNSTPAIETSMVAMKTAQTPRQATKKSRQPIECPLGLFGKSCQYLCHCGNNVCTRDGRCTNNVCTRDGRCTQGSMCEDGWFALGCQYNDLATGSEASDPLLTDNNDSTCYIPPENVIRANLTEPFVYTWVRVVFSGYVYNFSMSFHDSEECEDIRVVAEEKNQLDMFCSNEIVTTYIEITWQGNGSVCSLYINGGRNVAIESYIRMFKEEKTFDKKLLKDEIKTGTECLHFPSDAENKLIFRYTDQQTVTRIIVYTDEINNSFTLQGAFQNDQVSFQYKSLLGTRHVVYLSETKMSAVSIITFKVIEGSLNVCEIEVFGDCAPPFYYLACAETCILTCYKHLCNYNGFCYTCRHGRNGTHCMEGKDTKSWVDLEDAEKKRKKTQESVSVYFFIFIPIFGFAAFFYNALDLYKRNQDNAQNKDMISDMSQATEETGSHCSSIREDDNEHDDVDNFYEINSHCV